MDSDAYLLELVRYVVLNPVRAGIVKDPESWAWSSYRASRGVDPAPGWLMQECLLALFARNRRLAQQCYAEFVAEGINADSPWSHLNGQLFPGDEQFVTRMQNHIQNDRDDVQIPVAHRRPQPPPLQEIEKSAQDRNAAIIAAHATGGYSYQQIASYFGIHFTATGRVVRGRGG